MTPAEAIVAEAGLFTLGAGSIVAARSVVLAAITAARETAKDATFAAREALEKNWLGGGLTITPPNGRFLKPPKAEAAPKPAPEPVASIERRGAA